MSTNLPVIMIVSFIVLVFGGRAFSADTQSHDRTSILSYDLDAGLLFTDSFRGLSRTAATSAGTAEGPVTLNATSSTNSSSAGASGSSASSSTSAGYRSLGLRHIRMGFEWLTPRKLRARIKLRPDAVTHDAEVRRELDTRAGRSQDDEDALSLLDSYELALLRDSVEFAVGVRQSLIPTWKAYDDILSFGLEARGPRKVFGFFLESVMFGNDNPSRRLTVMGAVMSASGDLHDGRSTSDSSLDDGPSQKDPYWGGLLSANYRMSAGTSLGAAAAVTEERAFGGKVTNSFYELGVGRDIAVGTERARVALDVREVRHKFQTSIQSVEDLRLTSAALTSSIDISPERSLLLALRTGTGSFHSEQVTGMALAGRGVQGECGLRAWLGDGLDAAAIVTREWRRDSSETEGQVGGFGDAQNRRATISRFALQVVYRTGATL